MALTQHSHQQANRSSGKCKNVLIVLRRQIVAMCSSQLKHVHKLNPYCHKLSNLSSKTLLCIFKNKNISYRQAFLYIRIHANTRKGSSSGMNLSLP